MNELKVVAVKADQAIHFPADGSITYTVFKKTGENTWESCGEFIENESDALLYAASPDLLKVARLVLASQTWDGNDPDQEGWTLLYSSAREAVARATIPLERG